MGACLSIGGFKGVLGDLEGSWGDLGRTLQGSWGNLGGCRGHLGVSWGVLGAICGALEGILG